MVEFVISWVLAIYMLYLSLPMAPLSKSPEISITSPGSEMEIKKKAWLLTLLRLFQLNKS